MVRKRTFETTETFETTGTDDEPEQPEEDAPDVFLDSATLNQVPDPNGRTTLQIALGADQSVTSAWVIADLVAPDGTTEEVAAFGDIEISGADETGQRQTIITAPEADTFEIRFKGGYETGA